MKNKTIRNDISLLEQNSVVVQDFHKKFKDIDIGPISFNLEKGKVTAVLGSSGSGKSVFLNSLLGATLSYNGQIYINGKERKKASSIANNSEVGFYSQMDFSLYSISAYDFLKNMCNVMGIDKSQSLSRIEYWLKKFDLWSSKDKSLNAFSWGMKNRMNLILCFIKEPKILILDEPGANLDSKWRKHTYDILNEFKENSDCTIILTVHNINEVYNIIENFVILEKGKLLFSGTKGELNLYKKINATFGKDVDLEFVEKILNEYGILTFDFDANNNSITIALKNDQNFNDALYVLELFEIKTKDVVGQQINIDEIHKALNDKIKPHIPKYEQISKLVLHQKIEKTGEKLNKDPEILKEYEELENKVDHLDYDYHDILNEPNDKTYFLAQDQTIDSEMINLEQDDIQDAWSYLEKIEDKYKDIMNFEDDLVTISESFDEQKNLKTLKNTELSSIQNSTDDKAFIELKETNERFTHEKARLVSIKDEVSKIILELNEMKKEAKNASDFDEISLDDLKINFENKLIELKKYIQLLKNEDEVLELIKQDLDNKIFALKNHKDEIENILENEKNLIQNNVKGLHEFVDKINFETNVMLESKNILENKVNEMKEFLARNEFENQNLEIRQYELADKINEIKSVQNEINQLSISEKEELLSQKTIIENKLNEIKNINSDFENQVECVDKSKNELISKLQEFSDIKVDVENSISDQKENLQFEIEDLKAEFKEVKMDTDQIKMIKDELLENAKLLKSVQSEICENQKKLALIKNTPTETANYTKPEQETSQQPKDDELNVNKKINDDLFDQINLLKKMQDELINKNNIYSARKETKEMCNKYIDSLETNDCCKYSHSKAVSNNELYVDNQIDSIRKDLLKEKDFFEQMRKEIMFEKGIQDKLSIFDKELKARDEKMEMERLKREIQEEKNKLSEYILMQKLNQK